MQIREANQADVKELAALASRTYKATFGDSMSPQDLKTLLKETRSETYFRSIMNEETIMIAQEDDGKMIGYVQFGNVKIPSVNAGVNDRQLSRIYVDSHLYRRGIGSALMDAALAHPRMKDAANIYLTVWDENEKALGLYTKYGFREIGIQEVKIDNRVIGTDLVMVKS